MRARNPRALAALLTVSAPLAAGGVAVAKPDERTSEQRRGSKATFTYTLPGRPGLSRRHRRHARSKTFRHLDD